LTMNDPCQSLPPKKQRSVWRNAIMILGFFALGVVIGAILGLCLLPLLGKLILHPDYEIRPWDGQAVGGLAGLSCGIRRCRK
jgi:hypothetical protein